MLEIPGKVLEYNLVKKTFKKLYDFTPGQPKSWDHAGLKAFEFIKSLSLV